MILFSLQLWAVYFHFDFERSYTLLAFVRREIHGLEGGSSCHGRSASGLTHPILQVAAETSTVNAANEVETRKSLQVEEISGFMLY